MALTTAGEKRADTRLLAGLALGLIILLPPLFTGGGEAIGLGFFFGLLVPLIYFLPSAQFGIKSWRLEADLIGLLVLFFVFIIISVSVSFDHYASLQGIFLWLGVIVLFAATTRLFWSLTEIRWFSYAIVASGFLLGLVGFYFWLGTENTARLRFVSTFYHHNGYAGFILPAIFLALGYWLWSARKSERWFFGSVAVFLLTTLGLTFSRGGWLSFGLALSLALILSSTARGSLRFVAKLGLIVATAGLLTWGIFALKTYQKVASGEASPGVYPAETAEENALTARLHYFADAIQLIRKYPLGVGFGAYGDGLRDGRRELKYYTTDPHNLVLRLAAELGLLGGLVFLFLLAAIVRRLINLFRIVNRERMEQQALIFGLTAGLAGMIFHNLMDADWQWPANLILFWILVGLVLSLTRLSRDETFQSDRGSRLVWLTFVCFGFGLAIGGLRLVSAQRYFAEAGFLLGEIRKEKAIQKYKSAIQFDSLNPLYHRDLGLLFLKQARELPDTARQKTALALAKAEFEKTLWLRPNDAWIFYYEGQTAITDHNPNLAEAKFEEAIRHDPLNLLPAYRDLTTLFIMKKDYAAVSRLLETVLSSYPFEVFNSPSWINPKKEEIKTAIADLWIRLAGARLALNQKSEALTAFHQTLRFAPTNRLAAAAAACLKKLPQNSSPSLFPQCFTFALVNQKVR